jgi:ABC-type dipeptide/oligopeptide/nickel transport system ATPase component
MKKKSLLVIRDLNIFFKLKRKKIHIIRGVNITAYPGQIIGLVGESGSGKSVTTKAITNINFGATTDAEVMKVDGIDLLSIKKKN